MDLTSQERKELAGKVGMNEQYLYQCLTGRRDMDPVEAIRVERDSGGRVTRFDLCRRRGAEIWPEQFPGPGTYADMPQDVRQRVAEGGLA
jgi:DNA-binding transcriptional regulator YdaS (Cro superfamily)